MFQKRPLLSVNTIWCNSLMTSKKCKFWEYWKKLGISRFQCSIFLSVRISKQHRLEWCLKSSFKKRKQKKFGDSEFITSICKEKMYWSKSTKNPNCYEQLKRRLYRRFLKVGIFRTVHTVFNFLTVRNWTFLDAIWFLNKRTIKSESIRQPWQVLNELFVLD